VTYSEDGQIGANSIGLTIPGKLSLSKQGDCFSLVASYLEFGNFVFPLGIFSQDEVCSGFVVEPGIVDPDHRVVNPHVES